MCYVLCVVYATRIVCRVYCVHHEMYCVICRSYGLNTLCMIGRCDVIDVSDVCWVRYM